MPGLLYARAYADLAFPPNVFAPNRAAAAVAEACHNEFKPATKPTGFFSHEPFGVSCRISVAGRGGLVLSAVARLFIRGGNAPDVRGRKW